MKITVNGTPQEVEEGATVTDVLRALGLDRDGIAVAVRMQVVPRTAHPTYQLVQGDKVEVIRAVGGG
jgi:sulfur carrier protein